MFKEIKEMVRSGMKPKQAIASALAKKRKMKMMADGGMIDASDAEEMDMGSPEIPDPESMTDDGGYGGKNNEQMQRTIDDIARQGRFQEESIASPMQEDHDRMLAKALEMQNFAMGGLVEDGPEGDEPTGNEPSEDMDMEAPMPAEPDPMGSDAMMAAIEDRKKKRRYMR